MKRDKHGLTQPQRGLLRQMIPSRDYSYDQLGALSLAGQGLGSMIDSLMRKGMLDLSGKKQMLRGKTQLDRRESARFQLTAQGVTTRKLVIAEARLAAIADKS